MKTTNTAPLSADCPEAPLLDALAKRGYRQRDNLEWLQVGPLNIVQPGSAVVFLAAQNRPDDFLQPAAVLASRQPDVIVAEGEDAARAATSVTTTIPIVVNNVNDLAESGLVTNVARPGGNVTGVSVRARELSLKRVELLKEAFPYVKRPILIYGTTPSDVAAIGPSLDAARQMGLSPIPVQYALGCASSGVSPSEPPPTGTIVAAPTLVPAPNPFPPGFVCSDFRENFYCGPEPGAVAGGSLACSGDSFSVLDANLLAAIGHGADSVVVFAVLPNTDHLTDFLTHRLSALGKALPGIFPSRDYERAGAISLRQPRDMSAQVATYVDKILRGANPGELPIISPTTFEIVINLKAAQALGLTIAPNALAMATTVIR